MLSETIPAPTRSPSLFTPEPSDGMCVLLATQPTAGVQGARTEGLSGYCGAAAHSDSRERGWLRWDQRGSLPPRFPLICLESLAGSAAEVGEPSPRLTGAPAALPPALNAVCLHVRVQQASCRAMRPS